MAPSHRDFATLAVFHAKGEREFAMAAKMMRGRLSFVPYPRASSTLRNDGVPSNGSLQPSPRRLRPHPFELRQLMPEPGELPLGIMAGIGAADCGGLCQGEFALQMLHQRRHA